MQLQVLAKQETFVMRALSWKYIFPHLGALGTCYRSKPCLSKTKQKKF